jgi:hypothetical protein
VSAVIWQVGVLPLQLGKDQPENVPPLLGVAVSVTTVPVGNVAPHAMPSSVLQLMPLGLLLIVPPPLTATEMTGGSFQLAGGT